MNSITIDITPQSRNSNSRGLNKYDLLQSESQDILNQYKAILEPGEVSLTTVTDNDTSSKFIVAISTLNHTQQQFETLELFKSQFKSIADEIDPERLQFEISTTEDGDFCIYRYSEIGVSNIIINEDGSAAFSFISYKNSGKNDEFIFFEKDDLKDCEHLTYKFFSL